MAQPEVEITPAEFPVYELVSLTVTVRPNTELGEGSTIECQLPNSFNNDDVSPSLTKDWQTENETERNYVSVRSSSATFECRIEEREFVGGYAIPTRHGICVVAEVVNGSVPADGDVEITYRNTTSPWIANQRPDNSEQEGSIFVRVDDERVVPAPSFRVTPGDAEYLRVIAPSSADPDEQFAVKLVSLDEYNNCSRSSFDEVTLRAGETTLREGIDFTGKCTTPVSLSEPGVHRLTAGIPGWGDVLSNPIRISEDWSGPYFGDIHIHNEPSVDAMGNIPYEYARDISGLDFAAATEHGAIGLGTYWEENRTRARERNQPGEFVAIPAFEVNNSASFSGHMNLYFYEDIDFAPPTSMNSGDSVISTPELDAFLDDKRVVTQIHHTGWGFDMRREFHETTDLIEVYSMHGTSELYDPKSSIFMDKNRAREGDAKEGPHYVRDAWALGQRFSLHGSSDNHFGQGGVRYNSISGVYADELTRESVLGAMVDGQCYATTGERILLEFEINDHPMGSEFRQSTGDRLEFGIEVHGTDDIDTVEVFSCLFIEPNNEASFGELRFDEDNPTVDEARDSWETEYAAVDVAALDFAENWTATFDGKRRVYYARVKQETPIELPCKLEGQDECQVRDVYAWSGPIWVIPENGE